MLIVETSKNSCISSLKEDLVNNPAIVNLLRINLLETKLNFHLLLQRFQTTEQRRSGDGYYLG